MVNKVDYKLSLNKMALHEPYASHTTKGGLSQKVME